MTLSPDTALALAAAEAAAEVLPAVTPLTAAGAQQGTEHVTASFAGAATAQLTVGDGRTHRIAVLVGQDLVSALAESPLGGLDLAAATQPAVDAIAGVLGATARAGVVTEMSLVISDLAGPFTVVPLVGDGIDAAVLLPDALLSAPAATPAAVQPATATVPQQFGTASPQVFAGTAAAPASRGIEMLAGVDMEVTVELGRTRMTVRDLLALSPGTVLELDRAADGPADLLVNGRLIARGEVVVVDEDFGLRITEIIEEAGV
ncbi:flagellar motor switch protein FliN [Nocardioides jishulii]|uniref:Flagellar motor switch protein FliN n=1 Tax=Nocardioides jishulii TaxID=2575440 RepID=A0A4U2YST4_9ACTN|nr:flagellar motor switch protein FliN [Nocardioides jishulii]QCX28598.1 flagellar motor switch protein FliN [Nocardioides jishulii]TKI64509.1 flagellar motor switch protein FliN [Nocardioides jishulii]